MKQKISYISELDRSFDTPEAAIEDDKRLPHIISLYQSDLVKMETAKFFGGGLVTEKLKEQWRKEIIRYQEKWEAAQKSFSQQHNEYQK